MSDWVAKRFWTAAKVVEAGSGFAVHLDDKPLRTPGRSPLVVPTRPLAEMIAREWDRQDEKIDPTTLTMTRMANSAIERVGAQRAEVVDFIADYGATDLLCYRATTPRELVERQRAAWDPMLDWAAETFGARLAVTTGVMPVDQDPDALARLRAEVDTHDSFGLMGLHDLVSLTGSLVLGLAASRDVAPPETIWELSRVDESYQIEQWGEDSEASENAGLKLEAFVSALRFFQRAQ